MSAVQWIGTTLIALAAAMFFVGWFSRKSAEMDQHIADALNNEPRLHTEWSRLQAAVSQAHADIAAEAEEGTQLYDRLVCEQMERAEGWSA